MGYRKGYPVIMGVGDAERFEINLKDFDYLGEYNTERAFAFTFDGLDKKLMSQVMDGLEEKQADLAVINEQDNSSFLLIFPARIWHYKMYRYSTD